MAPRRALTEIELRHLRLLQFVRTRARDYARSYDEQIEDFVLELREGGVTIREIAETIGVGTSTVQMWTNHARQRRRASP